MNVWIDTTGNVKHVQQGRHNVAKTDTDVIRISMPEARRTYVGIAISRKATDAARRKAKAILRDLHQDGKQVILTDGKTTVEVMPSDTLAEANRFLLYGQAWRAA